MSVNTASPGVFSRLPSNTDGSALPVPTIPTVALLRARQLLGVERVLSALVATAMGEAGVAPGADAVRLVGTLGDGLHSECTVLLCTT